MGRSKLTIRRAYEEPDPRGGTRVLVDRLWPRGVKKERAAIDVWCKQVAPSTELRKWYGHDPARFEEFARRYRDELAGPEPSAALAQLGRLAARGPVTLVTATKDVDRSGAAVLAAALNVSA